ncbi:MAG: M1 family aminopeptidase [Gemmatimonadetes bacterium]|nr:M1 family aminopeptidase [Gemmatimonadota bacterium]
MGDGLRQMVVGFGLVTFGIGCVAQPDELRLEEGVSEELARHRRATLADLSYAYELSVPRDAGALTGTLITQFTLRDDSNSPVVIDFKDPGERVRTVYVNGEAAEWTAVFDHLAIDGSAFATDAHNEVSIEFEAGDEALNRNPDFLYTLFVPDRAHFSLPIFDQPDLKAPFSLTLEIPSEWVAVANGVEVSQELLDGGRTRYTYRETKPIPTYLLAFAVGGFQIEEAERGVRTFRMFHRETDTAKVARNLDAVFDLHATALDWLEDYTQIEYPYGKFDFVLLPPFQYGGMEHPGSIFYRQQSLLLDESATQNQIIGRASLIAHETSHQWFGDLVTMAWFDDVWTKEVFANFMAAKIVQPSFPDLNHDLRFFLAHHNTAYGVDRTPGANAVRQPLENLREAGTLYGAIIYQKAPIVMRQLELLVGEETFRDGMREYLTEFAHSNATWPDLIAILDDLSDEDLADWSRVWVEEPGRPTVSTELTLADGRVTELRISQSDPAGEGRVWPQTMEITLSAGGTLSTLPVHLDGEPLLLGDWVGRDAPDFVLPNGGGFEYGHFHLDAGSRQHLIETLPEITDAKTRGIAWVTLWDAVLEREVAVGDWYALLLRGAVEEEDEQSLQRVLGYLGSTFWGYLSEDERAAQATSTEEILWGQVEQATVTTRQSSYFNAWRNVVSTPTGLARLHRIWEQVDSVGGMKFSVEDYTSMATTLAILGEGDAEEILDRQFERIENPDRRARFLFVRPALSADPAVREAFFEGLSDPENRAREPWVLAALGYLHHPTRTSHSQRFVIPSLEMVEEIQRTGDIFFPQRWLGSTLGSHNDPALAADVKEWLDALPDDYPHRLRGKILQSTDGLDRAARIGNP